MNVREANEQLSLLVERVAPAVAERRKRKVLRQVKDALSLIGRAKNKYVIRKLEDAKKSMDNLGKTTGLWTPPLLDFYEKVEAAIADLK